MNRGVRTKRKERVVQVVVERSRLGALCLAQAYEQVVPTAGRSERGPKQRSGDAKVRAVAGGER